MNKHGLPRKIASRSDERQFVWGFTMVEIMIAISIIALVQGLMVTSWRGQVLKGNDATRKGDLAKIKTAFEEYYNDNTCYPALDSLSDCGSATLSPYLSKIPCDPTTKQPYYFIALDGDVCKGYRVLTKLENKYDPAIASLGCHGDLSCGFGSGYNYGISAGTIVLAPGVPTPTPTPGPTVRPTTGPTPSPTSAPTQFACSPQGECNIYANPSASGCPITFDNASCSNACADPANQCRQ